MQKFKASKYSVSKDGITQSLLRAYMECPRKFQLITSELGTPTRMPMELGSAGHKALETNGKEKYVVDKVISKEEQLQIEAYVRAIHPAYKAHYAQSDEALGIEHELVFDTPLCGIRLRGKIDGILNLDNGDVVILETKFKSRISEDALDRSLAVDWQSLFYVLAFWLQTGVRPVAVQYDVVRYPTIKFGMTPKEVYDATVAGTKKEPERWFYRWETGFSEEDIVSFRIELQQKIKELTERTVYYRNECACAGTFKCDFLDWCAAGDKSKLVTKKLFSELSK